MKVFERQTLADFAIITTGCQEGVFKAARINNVSVDADINGLDLISPKCCDDRIVEAYSNAGHNPATSADDEPINVLSVLGDNLQNENNENLTI